jgi:hypothetical protein
MFGRDTQRKQRSDKGSKRPGTPEAKDVNVTFRMNPETDRLAYEQYLHFRAQGFTARQIFLSALLHSSGNMSEGMTAPTNGLPEQSLTWLRDELISYLETHQMVVAAGSEDDGRPSKKVNKDDKNFFKTLFSGFTDDTDL